MAFARLVRLPAGVDLLLTLAPLQRGGSGDPTMRFEDAGVWRATRTPAGPATTHLTPGPRGVLAEAWGPGSEWALDHAPALLGSLDPADSFRPHHPLIAELHRRHPGLRLPRTEAVFEALVPTILEQKVPSVEAQAAYRGLVRTFSELAPGPAGLMLPPSPEALRAAPYWDYHRFRVERRRAETIRGASRVAARLEETLTMDAAAARRRLTSLPGVGVWSVEEVAARAFGDADALSLGDYHLPHLVSWALTGAARGSDELMVELLEPYRGHRARVIRLLEVGGIYPPRFGPRLPLRRLY
jgi:3-methyladenine DNA glycosylase/8-oxoguanine DNA glycosylase